MTSIVVHYQEIALKGNNRPWFVARLARNLRRRRRAPACARCVSSWGGSSSSSTTSRLGAVRDRVSRVFGVANFCPRRSAPLDVDAIAAEILEDLGERDVSSFRVSARRADKRFPLTSPQLEREVGGRIKEARGWRSTSASRN